MFYQTQNSVGVHFFECVRYNDFHFIAHMHRHHELLLVREGHICTTVSGQSEVLAAGEYAYIPSNAVHAYESVGTSVVDICVFSDDFIPTFGKELRKKSPAGIRFSCRPTIAALADEVLFSPDKSVDFYTRKGALYAIMGEVVATSPLIDCDKQSHTLSDRIIRYVAENYTDNISLGQMARDLGYDERYLSRCFHRTVPMHFSQYVNQLRVEAALELIKTSDRPLSEIAMTCGFGSIRSFNRAFLEVTGKTPREFQ